jgi:hypothetical protein
VYNFDENGNSTDPNDPTAVDPTHPNHRTKPEYQATRDFWARAHWEDLASKGLTTEVE